MGELLRLEKDQGVATVIFDRPPANALASTVLLALAEHLNSIENDEEVRVIVIRGEGRFFSAGADIKEFTTIASKEGFSDLARQGQQLFERMETFSKPIIAAIHGAALGGGLELAMACHMRFVTKTAKLGLPELQLGLVPGFAGSQRLPRYVGMAKATEMLLTSDPISGEEAVKWGLANAALEEDQLVEYVSKIARKIALKGPLAVKHTLHLVNYSKHERYAEGVEQEADAFGQVFVSEDGQEGIKAFIEKRQPVFKGK